MVFIITQGEYADFKIVSVWRSKESADREAERLNFIRQPGNDRFDVQAWRVQP